MASGTVADALAPGPRLTAALLRVAALDWRDTPMGPVRESAEAFGSYTGLPAQIELQPDGRTARLLRAISYTNAAGEDWPVPVGAWLDGASIPQALWSIIGGPFEGKYRDGSIVHDHYCIIRTRTWKATHRMFYEAMRCSGVGLPKAKIMYYAVYRFGPRWTLPPQEAEARDQAFTIPEAAADGFAADAEAIFVHDLSLDEIETLANARNTELAAAPDVAAEGAETIPFEDARLLVIVGGSGTAEDLAAVTSQAAILPPFVARRFRKKAVRIIACRQSITDFETDYRGEVPRGWEKTGRTWDDVPGAYLPKRNRVVIATIATADGRQVPDRTSGLHGSRSLVVHESLHGFDYSGGHAALRDRRFQDARTADLARLDVYERQDGDAGLEETFAESGARFVADRPAMKTDWPALEPYWETGPFDGIGPEAAQSEAAANEALGTAEMLEDGSLELDLRAEDSGGAIGHAVIRVEPTDAHYDALHNHLYGPETNKEDRPVGRILFRP
jgi:hypothetical protein